MVCLNYVAKFGMVCYKIWMFSTEISQATEKTFILVNQKTIQKNQKTKKRKTKKHRNQNKEFITKLFSWQCLGFCFLVSAISSYCLYVTVSPGVLILAAIDTCVSSFSDNIFSSFTNTPTIISTVLSVTSSLISYLLFVC